MPTKTWVEVAFGLYSAQIRLISSFTLLVEEGIGWGHRDFEVLFVRIAGTRAG